MIPNLSELPKASVTLVEAYAKRLFDGANVQTYVLHGVDEIVVQVTFHVGFEHLRLAERRSDRALADVLLDRFGRNADRARTAQCIRDERARHLSLKAARRTGRHKRLVEARPA